MIFSDDDGGGGGDQWLDLFIFAFFMLFFLPIIFKAFILYFFFIKFIARLSFWINTK